MCTISSVDVLFELRQESRDNSYVALYVSIVHPRRWMQSEATRFTNEDAGARQLLLMKSSIPGFRQCWNLPFLWFNKGSELHYSLGPWGLAVAKKQDAAGFATSFTLFAAARAATLPDPFSCSACAAAARDSAALRSCSSTRWSAVTRRRSPSAFCALLHSLASSRTHD